MAMLLTAVWKSLSTPGQTVFYCLFVEGKKHKNKSIYIRNIPLVSLFPVEDIFF